MRKTINLTIATDINGMGGIATVLNNYRQSGFLDRNNDRLIATHTGNRRFGGLNRLFLYLWALLNIAYYHIFQNVKLVHIHMSSRGSYLRKSLIIRLVKLLKGRVILHLHGSEFRDFYTQECSTRKQTHIRQTFEMSDAVVVLSTQWLDWAKATLNKSDHVRVIYNAVPILNLNRTDIKSGLIVFLGRIGQRKGVLDLIHAFPKVLNACPEAELILGGDGEIASFQKRAKALGIADSIHFMGWVADKDKKALLAKADVYCLPSYNEGFPMGILEAMSAGVPVVASNAGGIPDAIEHKKDGLLIDAGDVDALADALITMIQNRELNEAYSASANAKFKERFSVEAVLPQLDALYSEVLEKPGS